MGLMGPHCLIGPIAQKDVGNREPFRATQWAIHMPGAYLQSLFEINDCCRQAS